MRWALLLLTLFASPAIGQTRLTDSRDSEDPSREQVRRQIVVLQAVIDKLESRIESLEKVSGPSAGKPRQPHVARSVDKPRPPQLARTAPKELFYDDFRDDIGWKSKRSGIPDKAAPSKWKYVVATRADHEIVAGEGRNGGAAYRLKLDYPFGYAETGRLICEFEESTKVHIRLFMRVSEGFQFWAPGTTNNLWKQWRLHQSPWTDGRRPPFGTNGEDHTGYIVNTLVPGGGGRTYYDHHCCWRDDAKQSASGAQVIYKNRNRDDAVPWGNMQPDGRVLNPSWVQVDVYYELGEPNQDNGRIIQWFNGKLVGPFPSIVNFFGASPPITGDGLVTNPRSHYGNAPGFNSFTLFDNYINLTVGWTRQHYVYVDSVAIYDGIPVDLPLAPGQKTERP